VQLLASTTMKHSRNGWLIIMAGCVGEIKDASAEGDIGNFKFS
jgi:hypothetical protein